VTIAAHSGVLSFFLIGASVATADVTVDELVIESFYPADPETAQRMRALNASRLS
jgi:hypothetical protein